MTRLPLAELERRCQKPDYRLIGNWMARRVSRPLALRVTWLVLPWGLSAHAATGLAALAAAASAVSFGYGSLSSWLLGAALLQVWYLLDHVDGQLARFHGAASLDGVQLDYLMHHVVNLIVPWGLGFGLAGRPLDATWLVLGLVFSLGLVAIGLVNDTRYKAFIERLKSLEGELRVVGGAGGRPAPAPPLPRRPLKLAAYTARKACEIHVVMNALTIVAAAEWLLDDRAFVIARLYLLLMAPGALIVALATIVRLLRAESCEQEFARWYRPADGHLLSFDGRRWQVLPEGDSGRIE
ncbi:MAG TPA: CDP-alcohol phosphatidyltransferase family protein [Pirellulales bacterium]|nr:CDP-alcohol phosphatidyltransferase family protein [Pirellulales bacterium]